MRSLLYFYYMKNQLIHIYFYVLVQQPSTVTISPTYLDSTESDHYYNISNNTCQLHTPCKNNATCVNANTISDAYMCSCSSGFYGTHCEFDNRPCQPDTCWNNSK